MMRQTRLRRLPLVEVTGLVPRRIIDDWKCTNLIMPRKKPLAPLGPGALGQGLSRATQNAAWVVFRVTKSREKPPETTKKPVGLSAVTHYEFVVV